MCAKGKRSQERMLFLFSDMFMYAKVDSSGNYSACNILPLHKCEVSTVLCKRSAEDQKSQGGLFRVSLVRLSSILVEMFFEFGVNMTRSSRSAGTCMPRHLPFHVDDFGIQPT